MKKITIIGVGALGSHLVQFIRNMDVKLRIVDFDHIESKNTQSQFHAKNGVGKNKTQALSQLMQFLFNQKIETIPHKLVENNAKEILAGADLIIDCLDNAVARNIVQNYVRKNNIPCIHGGLSANGDFGRVCWDENFVIDKEPSTGAATCENGEHLPFIALTSSVLAQAVKFWLDSGKKVNYNITPGGVIKI